MEYSPLSQSVSEAFKTGRSLLAGKTSIAAFGDYLTLCCFSHVPVISDTLKGCFTTADDAISACETEKPDFLFVSENLESGYGLNVIQKVKKVSPETKCLIFLKTETKELVRDCLDSQADGVCFISSLGRGVDGDFINSLLAISDSGIYYPKEVRTTAGYQKIEFIDGITAREDEVLKLVVEGMTNKEISEELILSYDTVKSHCSSLLSKLNCRDRVSLILKAIKAGY